MQFQLLWQANIKRILKHPGFIIFNLCMLSISGFVYHQISVDYMNNLFSHHLQTTNFDTDILQPFMQWNILLLGVGIPILSPWMIRTGFAQHHFLFWATTCITAGQFIRLHLVTFLLWTFMYSCVCGLMLSVWLLSISAPIAQIFSTVLGLALVAGLFFCICLLMNILFNSMLAAVCMSLLCSMLMLMSPFWTQGASGLTHLSLQMHSQLFIHGMISLLDVSFFLMLCMLFCYISMLCAKKHFYKAIG